MLCFCLFSSSQTSEVSRPFPSLSSSSPHLRSQPRLAFQLTVPTPEHTALCSISCQGPLTLITHSHCSLLPTSRSLHTPHIPSVRTGDGRLCRNGGKLPIHSCVAHVARVLTPMICTSLIRTVRSLAAVCTRSNHYTEVMEAS